MVNETGMQFEKYGQLVLPIAELVLLVITITKIDAKIEEMVSMYYDDIPNPLLCEKKFLNWKRR